MFNENQDTNDKVGGKAGDVFGVATVIWELWYKQVPWEGKKVHAVLVDTTNGIRLDAEGPDTPPQGVETFGQPTSLLTDVWDQCWNATPESRPSISQVRTSTEKFLYSLNLPGQSNMGAAAAKSSNSGTVRKISKKTIKSSKKSTPAMNAPLTPPDAPISKPKTTGIMMKSPTITPNSNPLEPARVPYAKMKSLDSNQRLGTAL